ncbi:endonuclease domain-containing protein, partial [Candidatus Kuenenbacteria bacterium]|nr:endonuclease domain-containing protein [Candidatus Kuenenbacteria bacterium]
LRTKQFNNLKFSRQQVIGKYIVDFVCFNKTIIIELDGGQHAEKQNKIKDKIRERWLKSQGFIIIRFWDNDVLKNIEGVWDEIAKRCHPSPQPSPTRGEGERKEIF